jgi:CrcB protein
MAIQSFSWGAFYLGTMCANVLGCFAIGVLIPLLSTVWVVREEYRLALLVGVLGGFTTFSSYAFESIGLYQSGERTLAVLNVLLSNLLGLGAAWAGFALAERWFVDGAA